MKLISFFIAVLLGGSFLPAQEVDPVLTAIKSRMDSIVAFEASVEMEVDISFVTMPVKEAEISYVKGEPIAITSEDFVMIPKRGLDLTLNELYRYPFMTLSLGKVQLQGRECDLIKIIPTTEASDFSIASVWVDRETLHVLKSQISTKKNGVYDIFYTYQAEEDPLPSEIRVEFEVSGVKIPLRFLGRDTQIDKDKKDQDPQERGAIYLRLAHRGLTLL
ncbi:hypothetical protein [Robiginitalea aurantiaca]|uniref:Outer membrane lipoprotein-sorting protein n=1 Tax=Robiginitalea aurantiaca TaxID=3056915 RepID=A0ABT7WFY0_9FLAO|nr:hypothetical protein [Robiginitalea aurantiaca]MDM9631827.1 hypothetical protein [Robiginitalea aurantiaca]